MFLSAVAGPSRLPYQPAAQRAVINIARSYATDNEPSPTFSTTLAPIADRPGARPRVSYPAWRKSIGLQFKHPTPGAKAKWLGGSVPYPMNPSFRPPPPLGNDAQDALYREMQSGEKTMGQISADYNVSIGRLAAIRKLKQVEEHFKQFFLPWCPRFVLYYPNSLEDTYMVSNSNAWLSDQSSRGNVPLQTAYRQGMEPLLGCKPFIDARLSKNTDVDESASAELDEERRWRAGIGGEGAFGNRDKPAQGWEKTAFEWRGEGESFDAKAAGVSEDLFPTPDSERAVLAAARPKTKTQRPDKLVRKNDKTSWRFTDYATTGMPQDMNVLRDMQKRDRRREKRRVYKNKKKGIFE